MMSIFRLGSKRLLKIYKRAIYASMLMLILLIVVIDPQPALAASNTDNLSLTVDSLVASIRTGANIIATIQSPLPQPNISVKFVVINGPCQGTSGEVATDEHSTATFTYICQQTGTDTIVATTTLNANQINERHLKATIKQQWEVPLPAYVAFGDSITTGGSIPDCHANRQASPWGCMALPAATPYPDLLASKLGYTQTDDRHVYKLAAGGIPDVQLDRVGIWGDTLEAAVQARKTGKNNQGRWMPQLEAVESARGLVTGSLGINDLHFSNLSYWLKLYLSSIGSDKITPTVKQLIAARDADFNQLFDSLNTARMHGSQVILTLYYNPYDSGKLACTPLKTIGDRLVNTLDDELTARAAEYNFTLADLRGSFAGHGAGSPDSYVFGNHCALNNVITDLLPDWLNGGGKTNLVSKFDPHPNLKGTNAIADLIYRKIQWASD